jgi:hypothetical protein
MAEQPKQAPGEHWAEKRVFQKPATLSLASAGIDKNLAHRASCLEVCPIKKEGFALPLGPLPQ